MLLAAMVVVFLWFGLSPAATQPFPTLRATLTGFEETPAISTGASGSFVARIRTDAIDYELSYADLESAVTQAHIHFGQPGVMGGISVWLCSNLASPPTPAGTQSCPTPSGTVSGTIIAANVVGPTGQGIAAGQFDELVRAILNGIAYANVHSNTFPAGEIRGQIRGTNFSGTGP